MSARPRLFENPDPEAVRKWLGRTPKWALAEALMHFAAARSEEGYESALETGQWFTLARAETERWVKDRRSAARGEGRTVAEER